MADPAPTSGIDSNEAAVKRIREVTQWLIGAFAAIGVALAAGSQLSEIGTLTHFRLGVALVGVGVVLIGATVAILSAVRVLSPAPISIQGLVAKEQKSAIGKQVKKNPALLQGHGETIADFDRILKAANRKVDETYDAYQGATAENETELATAFKTAEAERLPINETLDWLLGYAGYLEVEARFKRARILMFAAGIAAAAGIASFAWAAHPEKKSESSSSAAVPASPAEITVDLSPAGEGSLKDALGAKCNDSAFDALALGGPANAIEAVAIPTAGCEPARFVLTPSIGTFEATDEVN